MAGIREVRGIPYQRSPGPCRRMLSNMSGTLLTARGLKKHSRKAKEKYRIVAEGASEGIAIIRDGRFEYVNPCLAHMAGVPFSSTAASFIRFISPELLLICSTACREKHSAGNRTRHLPDQDQASRRPPDRDRSKRHCDHLERQKSASGFYQKYERAN